jgi:hypothetical protein
MEAWRRAWRDGFSPLLSAAAKECLLIGLDADDPCIVQGKTCEPPEHFANSRERIAMADALSFAGWQAGEHDGTVGGCQAYFDRLSVEAAERLGKVSDAVAFLNWYDSTPRAEMRRELADELRGELLILSQGTKR